jgi:hypothetical protein
MVYEGKLSIVFLKETMRAINCLFASRVAKHHSSLSVIDKLD